MKNPDVTECLDVADNNDPVSDTHQIVTRILILDVHPVIREELGRFITQHRGLGVCIGAEDVDRAVEAIEKEGADLAIVDISSAGNKSRNFTEKIRLQFPHLPLLVLSINDPMLSANPPASPSDTRLLNTEPAKEKLVAAIRYVNSLLRSDVHGFSIFIEL